jgi:hypothetical protein
MADKKPEGIPISDLMRSERALPEHRRKLHRKARELAMSTDGITNVSEAIEDEYLQLSEADKKRREAQAAKARKPRGAIEGTDGERRTMADLIAKLERDYRGEEPRDVWPHLQRAIEEWAGECERVGTVEKPVYSYPFNGKKDRRTISYKQFRELFRKAREAGK